MEEKDAYICYNSNDFAWVKSLAEQLESETIDGSKASRYLQVFFDRWDMGPGDSLIDKMNEGMKKARHVVAVLSPEFLKANWPRFEWKHIVADDPNNSKGRLIPILWRDTSLDGSVRIDLPAPFRELKYIDFRKPAEFKRSFNELVGKIRNLPPERGRKLPPIAPLAATIFPPVASPEASWLPDQVPEFIFSNLFPVKDLPLYIWHAETPFTEKEKAKVWEKVPNSLPFILRSKRLYTFARLESDDERLRDVIDVTTVKRDSRVEWALNADKHKWLMSLLNTSLNNHLRQMWIRTNGKGRFYFAVGDGDIDRTWPMPAGKPRTVAKHIVDAEKELSFWVHHGSEAKFRRIEDKIFLSIVPLYLFTKDGTLAIGGKAAGKLSQKWMGKQQNPHIFRDVLFWAYVMSSGHPTIKMQTGDQPITIDGTPATSKMQNGVAFDAINMRTFLQHKDSELEDVASRIGDLDEDEEEDEQEES